MHWFSAGVPVAPSGSPSLALARPIGRAGCSATLSSVQCSVGRPAAQGRLPWSCRLAVQDVPSKRQARPRILACLVSGTCSPSLAAGCAGTGVALSAANSTCLRRRQCGVCPLASSSSFKCSPAAKPGIQYATHTVYHSWEEAQQVSVGDVHRPVTGWRRAARLPCGRNRPRYMSRCSVRTHTHR